MQPYSFVIENTWIKKDLPHDSLLHFTIGWGNGYVAIPKGHPWYGKEYENIPVQVHGGLTYGEFLEKSLLAIPKKWIVRSRGPWYIIGFDTGHYRDTPERWTKKAVEIETQNLLRQVIAASK